MSRGFVKEDDQEDIPIVPPRADLPQGVQNYVTPAGMEALIEEKEGLLQEIVNYKGINDNERRIAINFINAKLQLLQERLASAKVVDLATQPQDEVRFGATVTLKVSDMKAVQKYQIVGVDEADITKGKISFTSPIAQLLTNKKVGDTAVLKRPQADRVFEITQIEY